MSDFSIETQIKNLVLEVLKEQGLLHIFSNEKSMIEGDYFDTFEVGKKLKQSHHYICKLIRQGKIKGKKIGKKWLVHKEDLKEYLANIK